MTAASQTDEGETAHRLFVDKKKRGMLEVLKSVERMGGVSTPLLAHPFPIQLCSMRRMVAGLRDVIGYLSEEIQATTPMLVH